MHKPDYINCGQEWNYQNDSIIIRRARGHLVWDQHGNCFDAARILTDPQWCFFPKSLSLLNNKETHSRIPSYIENLYTNKSVRITNLPPNPNLRNCKVNTYWLHKYGDFLGEITLIQSLK